MTTNHHARAGIQMTAAMNARTGRGERRHLAWALVHATLADRCPDPAAHQAAAPITPATRLGWLSIVRSYLEENGVDVEPLLVHLGVSGELAAHRAEDGDLRARVADYAGEIVRLTSDRNRNRDLLVEKNAELAGLRTELAEARAAHQAEDEHTVTKHWDAQGGDVLYRTCTCGEEWAFDEDSCPEDDDERDDALVRAHNRIAELRRELADVWKHFKTSEEGRLHMEQSLNAKLAEARASRPAPMPPEVVAVVAAWTDWDGDPASDGMRAVTVAIEDLRRALPEGWRDGAAPADEESDERLIAAVIGASGGQESLDGPHPHSLVRRITINALRACLDARRRGALAVDVPAPAAVPAVLDEAGVERAARVMAGIDATAPWGPLTEWQLWRDRARAAVRAYLGDTDTDDSREG